MTTNQLRERLQDELAVAIAVHRTGAGAGNMARQILSRERRAYYLIGITSDGQRVGYFDLLDFDATLVPFDESGVDGLNSSHLDRFDSFAGLEAFLQEHGDRFGWVHPRFRWVLDE